MPKKSDNTILIKIVNLSQKAAIKEIQAELLIFAKNELANDFINLIIEISQSHKTKEWLVLNKIDNNKNFKKKFKGKAILVSAKTGEGLEGILEKIYLEIIKKIL